MAHTASTYTDATCFNYDQYEAPMDSTKPGDSGYQMRYEGEAQSNLFPTSPALFLDECIDPRLLIKNKTVHSARSTDDTNIGSMTERQHYIEEHHFETPYNTAPREASACASSFEANDSSSETVTWSHLSSASDDSALSESG